MVLRDDARRILKECSLPLTCCHACLQELHVGGQASSRILE